MESSNKQRVRFINKSARAGFRRQGKITIVTLIAILGLLVLAGFVGNAGHVVTSKVSSQNASDAIAFSSAQWMARGMNAVTATNHMLGEVTAIIVILEGLGGPEAFLDMKDYPPQSDIPDKVNRQLIPLAKVQGLVIYGAPTIGTADEKFLNLVVKDLISKEKDPEHKAFAMIYDGKVILKRATTKRLLAKMFANIGLYVPPPFGYASAAAAYIAHGVADFQLVSIAKEYLILHGFELLVTSGPVKKFKLELLEKKLVPALAAHGDYLAGLPPRAANNEPRSQSGVVNDAVRDTLTHLRKVYQVDAAIYPTAYTSPVSLRLPIEAEPAPPENGRTFRAEQPEWGTDELTAKDNDDQLKKLADDMQEKKDQINERIKKHEEAVAALLELRIDANKLKTKEGVTDTEVIAINKEIADLDTAIKEQRDLVAERRKDLAELEKKEAEMKAAIAKYTAAPPGSGNISVNDEHLAFAVMDQKKERYTQWTRATYPYVAAFRAPMLALFEKELERCEASANYRKWTTRYTLTNSWKFRSAFRLTKDTDTQARWTKNDPKIKPLRMYVMDGSYERNKNHPEVARTGRFDRKGLETWTLNTDEGKNLAEDKFTIVAMTQSKMEPMFSPVLFPLASKRGMTTYAQAMFYNANRQVPHKWGEAALYQAKLGWDTLNWDPAKSVPEWGHHTVLSNERLWPWEIFDAEKNKALKELTAVKLNWQAKLMPVRIRRLTPAVAAATVESKDMGENVLYSLPYFLPLVHH